MKNIIILVLGDWAHDGHGKSSIVTIRSNLTKPEIEEAYRAGIKKVGFSFEGSCFRLNSTISQEQIELLEKANVDTSCIEVDSEEEEPYVDEECFVDIYMEIVELGNSDIEWERVFFEENHIRIGGYGLFR